MQAITTNDLTKTFGKRTAVSQINITVEAGEIFGFLGPNGAGKTTTIRMLTGQLLPTSGSAHVAGFDITSQRDEIKSRIGVVFEYQNLYERLSARDNLNFMRSLYGIRRARVGTVLELVGLEDRADEMVKTFSNGMKQRLLIARSLLHDPDILFLDEPTRGLDPLIAHEIRELIANLVQEGHTIFLTTHYMEEADQLCHHIALINQGAIIAMGTPDQLKRDHGPTLEHVFIHLVNSPLKAGHQHEN